MDDLLSRQSEVEDKINKFHTNYNKDADSRKTKSYLEKKIEQLRTLYSDYEKTDEQIISHSPALTQEHEYRKTRTATSTLVKKLIEEMRTRLDEKSSSSNNQTTTLDRTLRQQDVKMRSLYKEIRSTQQKLDSEEPEAALNLSLTHMERMMNQISDLHDAICLEATEEDEISLKYFTHAYYDEVRKAYDDTVVQVVISKKSHKVGSTPPADIKLPKIQIPHFSGDHMKWMAFQDVFEQLVHKNNALNNTHKMSYLKTYTGGQAAKLINHLQSVGENYEVAWTIIKDRYDNRRMNITRYIHILMSQPTIINESASALRALYDTTRECLHAIKQLGINTDSWDQIIIYVLAKKLDHESLKTYEMSLENSKEIQKLEEFMKFLESRFTALEAVLREKTPYYRKPAAAPRTALLTTNSSKACNLCSQNHHLADCSKFKIMNIFDKNQLISLLGVCRKCLNNNHRLTDCRAKCVQCQGQHHLLLHNTNAEKHKHTTTNSTGSPHVNSTTLHARTNEAYVILPTALVKTITNTGEVCYLRAIIDPCSQATLITSSAVNKLKLKTATAELHISGISAKKKEIATKAAKLSITPRFETRYSLEIEAYVVNEITENQPRKTVMTQIWDNLDHLADPNFHMSAPIDLLLGADYYTDIVLPDVKKVNNHQPIAQNTRFGWIILGRSFDSRPTTTASKRDSQQLEEQPTTKSARHWMRGATDPKVAKLANELRFKPPIQKTTRKINPWLNPKDSHSATELPTKIVAITAKYDALEEIEKTLKKFWETEELHPQRNHNSEEEMCEQHFHDSHKRELNGRYTLEIPFRQQSNLGDSRKMATARFLQLERQLIKNEELAKQYKDFMREYEYLGHMEKVDPAKLNSGKYYMPHHAVLKPSSTTTKLRVVFDASARTTNGLSLNDIMHVGPKIQQDLWHIVMRWRKHKYVITADIEKMFRQIWIHEKDRVFQRILWRNSPSDILQEYQLKTITYGTSAATYLAVKTLHQLAEDEKQNFPIACRVLQTDFYVDDLMTGCNTIKETLAVKDQLTELLQKGGFNLRKWASNNTQLSNNGEHIESHKIEIDQSIKALGLFWKPKADIFEFNINTPILSGPLTKRNILSTTAKLFDPLGWLAPVIITPKIMLQKMWLMGLNWDETVPEALAQQWSEFKNNLIHLDKLKIPRWLNSASESQMEVHGFSDASEQAYAACVYLRVTSKGNEVNTSLIAAKTRVAPTKTKLTLPRLELNASLLLAKLLKEVKQALEMQQTPTVAWTDSTIVLSWIQGDIQKYKTYVANRISEIRNLTEPRQWRHIKSGDNPADCASRGITVDELINHKLWWTGPTWLKNKHYNSVDVQTQFDPEEQETKEIKCINFTTIPEDDDRISDLIKKTSGFTKLKRTVKIIVSFIKKCRKIKVDQYDLNEAEKIIVKHIQRSCYNLEISQLMSNNTIGRKSKLLSLNPFLDTEGILRVGGRLHKSLLNYEEKHPAILPAHHQFTKSLVNYAHLRMMHGGLELTLSFIRKKYWIIRGRPTTKSIISKCVICHRFKTNPGNSQLMGTLPSARVQPTRPFTHTGVDYAGPVQIKTTKGRGSKTYKAYIAIFVCLSTKAIHVEAVTDLTTDAFIAALKRFTSRRGLCSNIYSDNGTNFVGANNELRRLQKQQMANFNDIIAQQLATEGITWHFQPPASSHFGGLWEAGVKSVKTHLKKIVGNAILTYEELTTLLNQIEAILNSRPLCPISNDITNLEVLTPGHFLIGTSLTTPPIENLIESNIHRLTRWQMLEKLKQDFWKKWSNEYLRRLQQRPKWLQSKPQLKVGDLVLLIEDNLPPTKWVRGRIAETHPGSDGLVRVVSVRGPGNALYKRAITKLSVLPINEPQGISADETTSNYRDNLQQRRVTRAGTKSTLLLYMLSIFCILGTVASKSSSKYNISNFSSHPGIYFDRIGQSMLINGEWKLITYYNLTTYWAELDHLERSTRQLDEICGNRTHSNATYIHTIHCGLISSQMRNLYIDIREQNELLNTVGKNENSRHKRSPFDFVGTIANELFGVLDQRAGNFYKESIANINSNQQQYQKLLQQQMSIIESTVNIMKHDHEETNQKFEAFREIMTDLIFHEEFTDIALHTMLDMMKLRTFQSAVIDTITEVHQGNLNPLVVTPHQLREQTRHIIDNLKPSQDIPYRSKDIAAIYKITTVRTIKIGETIIFEVKIPLIQRTRYTLYNVIPVPTLHEQQYVYIQPSSSYLMITSQQDKYLQISANEFNDCALLNGEYLCNIRQPLYDYNSNESRCEIQILKQDGEIPSSCQILHKAATTIWIPLHRYNAWIFVISSKTTCNVVCEHEVDGTFETTTVSIQGEGVLELHQNCIFKGDTFTVAGYKTFTNEFKLSFLPQFNLSEKINVTNIANLQLSSNLPEIEAIEMAIQEHKKSLQSSTTKVNIHDYHHYLAIYLLIPVALFVIGWHMYRRMTLLTHPPPVASLPTLSQD